MEIGWLNGALRFVPADKAEFKTLEEMRKMLLGARPYDRPGVYCRGEEETPDEPMADGVSYIEGLEEVKN